LLFFCKNKRLQNFGQIFFGAGALFFGLQLMKDGVMPLSTVPWFHELAVNMSINPLLGVFFGTVFTIILQSSGLTVEILQDLFGHGLVDIHSALPVLFGNNIGTTITPVLATIGASIAAKRAALTHVILNVIGTVVFMIFLPLFTIFIKYLQAKFYLSTFITIAFAHS
jgi:phosphate:Na+ symporter